MRKTHSIGLLSLFLLLCSGATAQTPAVTHFDKDGLSFDYPASWTLTDRSTPQLQHLSLTRPGSSALVMVVSYRELLQSSQQILSAHSSATKTFVEAVAQKLGVKELPTPDKAECIKVGGHSAQGFRMVGQVEGQQSTGEVYSLVMGQRFANLLYVRQDKDDAEGALVWKSVLDTLRVEPPPNQSPEAAKLDDIVMGGVLNGHATSKPLPIYPITAKRARVQGTVLVQIVVDEKGNVVSANAIEGPPLLREAGEEAASKAKFTPTLLCGRPVKVTGIITYHWVLQ